MASFCVSRCLSCRYGLGETDSCKHKLWSEKHCRRSVNCAAAQRRAVSPGSRRGVVSGAASPRRPILLPQRAIDHRRPSSSCEPESETRRDAVLRRRCVRLHTVGRMGKSPRGCGPPVWALGLDGTIHGAGSTIWRQYSASCSTASFWLLFHPAKQHTANRSCLKHEFATVVQRERLPTDLARPMGKSGSGLAGSGRPANP